MRSVELLELRSIKSPGGTNAQLCLTSCTSLRIQSKSLGTISSTSGTCEHARCYYPENDESSRKRREKHRCRQYPCHDRVETCFYFERFRLKRQHDTAGRVRRGGFVNFFWCQVLCVLKKKKTAQLVTYLVSSQ